MLAQERYDFILNILNEKGSITVNEICEQLNISESTIRRDLITLDEMGKLTKVYGGAVSNKQQLITDEDDVNTKATQNVEEKTRIAKYAASLINDADFVYIDAGTTTEKMIDFIGTTKARFVTNGIVHAKKLIQKGLKAYVIGGELKLKTEAIVGAEGLNSMKKYNFTKAFMGANGVSVNQGFTTPEIEEAIIKTEAVKKAHISYVLIDHTKIDRINSITFAAIDEACIITGEKVKDSIKNATVVKEVF